jgi:hypothetical protein
MADVFDRHAKGVVQAYIQAALNMNLQWAAPRMFDELTNENWEAGREPRQAGVVRITESLKKNISARSSSDHETVRLRQCFGKCITLGEPTHRSAAIASRTLVQRRQC